jgi:peptidyl-prolyl cis-trans isomerase B (cyclophilin B)
MNRLFSLVIVMLLFLATGCAQDTKKDFLVTIKTPHGTMYAILYDETPQHKANFIKLVREKYYDSLLFHRVIQGFMIQGGDPDSRDAKPGQALGRGGPGYTLPAEINPKFFHEKGALSAARMGDQVNPKKESNGSQFYIVQGTVYPDSAMKQLEDGATYQKKNNCLRQILEMPQYASLRQQIINKQQAGDGAWLQSFFEKSDTLIVKVMPDYKPTKFSPEQKDAYSKKGGAPHLDNEYTVFGKVIKGLEIIDKIAAVEKGIGDRPVVDQWMVITVEEVSKKKIEKEFGYVYPTAKK